LIQVDVFGHWITEDVDAEMAEMAILALHPSEVLFEEFVAGVDFGAVSAQQGVVDMQ